MEKKKEIEGKKKSGRKREKGRESNTKKFRRIDRSSCSSSFSVFAPAWAPCTSSAKCRFGATENGANQDRTLQDPKLLKNETSHGGLEKENNKRRWNPTIDYFFFEFPHLNSCYTSFFEQTWQVMEPKRVKKEKCAQQMKITILRGTFNNVGVMSKIIRTEKANCCLFWPT